MSGIRAASIVAALVLSLAPAGARAQSRLPRLDVRSFTLRADRIRAVAGAPLRLTIELRVRERIGTLDVTLPNLFRFEIDADERHTTSGSAGTIYREQLTVHSATPGAYRIAPAQLLAIDARSGKPSVFTSNAIEVRIVPPARSKSTSPAWWVAVVASIAAIAAAVAGFFAWRRRRPVPTGRVVRVEPEPEFAASVAPLAIAAPPRFDVDHPLALRRMINMLAARPTRARVLALRELLRVRAGAREDETFGDLVARHAQTEYEPLMQAMRGLERAAFITDDYLDAAVADAIAPLEFYAAVVEAGRL